MLVTRQTRINSNVISVVQTCSVCLICLMLLMLFQKPATELLDRPCSIIHWETYFHAIHVRVKFQVIINNLMERSLKHLIYFFFFCVSKKDLRNQFAIWSASKGTWKSHKSPIIVSDRFLHGFSFLNNSLVITSKVI